MIEFRATANYFEKEEQKCSVEKCDDNNNNLKTMDISPLLSDISSSFRRPVSMARSELCTAITPLTEFSSWLFSPPGEDEFDPMDQRMESEPFCTIPANPYDPKNDAQQLMELSLWNGTFKELGCSSSCGCLSAEDCICVAEPDNDYEVTDTMTGSFVNGLPSPNPSDNEDFETSLYHDHSYYKSDDIIIIHQTSPHSPDNYGVPTPPDSDPDCEIDVESVSDELTNWANYRRNSVNEKDSKKQTRAKVRRGRQPKSEVQTVLPSTTTRKVQGGKPSAKSLKMTLKRSEQKYQVTNLTEEEITRRRDHNHMERLRRQYLSNCLTQLQRLVVPGKKVGKESVLRSAKDLILQLKEIEVKLIAEKDALMERNVQLTQRINLINQSSKVKCVERRKVKAVEKVRAQRRNWLRSRN